MYREVCYQQRLSCHFMSQVCHFTILLLPSFFSVFFFFFYSDWFRYRLATEYGTSVDFSDLWDRLQQEGRCCGVFGPQDFSSTTNRSYPISCCSNDINDQISISRRPMASAIVFRNDDTAAIALTNQAKINFTELTDLPWNHLINDNKEEIKTVAVCRAIYQQGCLDKVIAWLRNTADILFVVGYCVIAFLKLSFLGILRYEIREMIQKIKLLQAENTCEMLSADGDNGSQHHNYQQVNRINQHIYVYVVINGGVVCPQRIFYYYPYILRPKNFDFSNFHFFADLCSAASAEYDGERWHSHRKKSWQQR